MILVIHIWISAWIIYFFTIQAREIYCSYVLSRYGQGVATTRRSMRRHVRRATPLSPLTRQYIHLHFLTSGPLLTVHVIHSITCKSLFLCPLLLRTWEPPQRHYWGDLPATFHFLRWRQHFWNPPIKVADNVTWPDNVASAQVTSSRALPIWDFDRPTKRGGGDTWVFWFLGKLSWK